MPTAEMDDVLLKCYQSTGIFGKTFMPETFCTEFSILHHRMLEALDGPYRKVVIAGPRGLGKTKTVQAKMMQQILFRTCQFMLYITNSENVGVLQAENLKRELRTNMDIRKMFGDIAISDADDDFSETFSKKAWVAYGETLILPRGCGQQIRGLTFGRHRPQWIFVDDLEKRSEMSNPDIRAEIKQWFHADVEKCVDFYSNDWRIIYMDTLKHGDSLLAELMTLPDWHVVHLDLCDDDYHSNVPAMFTDEELAKLVESHRVNNTMDVFYMEYRNLPVSKENASFEERFFQRYAEPQLDPVIKRRLENVIIVDPAKTVQMQSAESAIVGLGVDYVSGAIYVRDIVNRKMFPNQLYDEIFAMRQRLNAHAIGIEVTGLEEFIKQPILNEMQRRGPGHSFEPVWLKARGGSEGERGKLKRIGALVPYYRQGYIKHNVACCGPLERQLLEFPRGKLVDVADATAYVIEMLELGERYFNSPVEDDAKIEDEFADLEYDEPLGDGWRRM